ncbi:MAG: ParB N-terminal domain-containing protein [Candidatus Gastranaerophilales bacterium]|nr:ParB N-terminal domain-containing protein [Candidatus Gastranaerophilales bacterium]
MQNIEIDKITINKRKRSSKDIKELAESIKKIGLLNPITLNKDLVLIAGFHRLQACKQLDWKDIPATIIDADNLTAELAEIDENLIRTSLTALENAEQLKRRKEIYELLHPESKAEEQRKKGLNVSNEKISQLNKTKTFVEDTAKKIGKSPRSVQQDIQIANNISEEVKQEIKGTEIENKKTVLLEIAKQPAEQQKKFVEKVISGQPTKETEIHISVEIYEKVKLALDEAEYELDLIKKENQELKAKIKELEKQLSKDNTEVIKNDLIEDEKIDYANRKVLVDNEWLQLPPAYDMTGKKHEQMYWIANNYNKNKQKES